MRTGIILAFALTLLSANAGTAQASPLIPAANLAGIETNDAVVLVHHRAWHKKKKGDRGRHLGWTRGKHKGWAKKH